ncbi:ketopantoate reductase family protein [Haloferula sargassicola]|uniref:2-dehydropantoate 2-reductase n=1 Tax=Haloferula sargassicola TaxID=490096 RepID=A0ABP9UQ88_9BACT
MSRIDGSASQSEAIHILGGGAIGAPFSVFLSRAGTQVRLVRTSRGDFHPRSDEITVDTPFERVSATVETVSVASLPARIGLVVVACKAYANPSLAKVLRSRVVKGPIILLQNGLGVEKPFIEAGFPSVQRAVVYATSQAKGQDRFSFRMIRESPLGIVAGSERALLASVATLSTPFMPFRSEPDITPEVWRKTIINSVFNSICTIMEEDNGLFCRNVAAREVAEAVVGECVRLAAVRGVTLAEEEIMDSILSISGRSTQLISTLQDVRAGRPTEMRFLNEELARLAGCNPRVDMKATSLLAKLVEAKVGERSSVD